MYRRRWGRLALAAALLLGVACASTQTVVVWEKPGGTDEELAAAREACKGEPGVEQLQVGRERTDAELRGNAFVRCMEARGWSWKTEPGNGG
jgi:hypothetical protein